MPIVTTTTPASGSFAQLQVKYVQGYHPSNPSVCGQTPSLSGPGIDVFQYARDANDNRINCLDYAQQIIAHEVGHYLGLDHPGNCNSIMAPLSPGTSRSVTPTDCQVAKDNLTTYGEQNYISSPNCTEPCYGPCNSFGNCPAEDAASPIVVSLRGQHYILSGLDDPVAFDLDADGTPEPIGWTARGHEAAFLVLDLDQNGRIDDGTELFGDSMLIPGTAMRAANGFEALRAYDIQEQGGNSDQVLTEADLVFSRLRLWIDADHDAITDAGELRILADEDIIAIDLDYEADHRVDRHGNIFAYRGSAQREETSRAAAHEVRIWDVYLIGGQQK